MRIVMCLDCDTALICNDTEGLRECNCGKTKLLQENKKKFYCGDTAFAICVPDETFVKGVKEAEDKNVNVNVLAYVCHTQDEKIYKVEKI
jgi:hypothetical protein